MTTVKEGDTIRVHYTGRLENGTVFDSSEDSAPLQFTVGRGELIRGFEQGVIGMSAGDSKTIRIAAEDAYGPHKKEMVFEFGRDRAPENFDPQIGQQVNMQRADGKLISATIVAKSDKSFTMDCNHPLAGKDIIFDVRLLEII